MTDPAPYTDDEVEALATELRRIYEQNLESVADARCLLDAGYRKVTPDTPPEPQERYVIKRSDDQYAVWDQAGETNPVSVSAWKVDADRIVRLLNLDAKYEDQGGIGKVADGLAGALGSARERLAVAVEQRDEARAEVERLTAELITQREGTPGQMVRNADPAPADPQDDGPIEPLFTGYVGVHGGPSFAQVPGSVGVITVMADTGLRVNDRVDVYPHGQRPTGKGLRWVAVGSGEFEAECQKRNASLHGQRPTDTPTSNRPVTDDDVYVVLDVLRANGWDVSLPIGTVWDSQAVADALNDQLSRGGDR